VEMEMDEIAGHKFDSTGLASAAIGSRR